MTKVVHIGCGSSCGACRLEEAERLLTSGRVQYLSFDRLAERTTGEMLGAIAQGRSGYCPEFERYTRALLPGAVKRGIRLVTNAGGEQPECALKDAVQWAKQMGLRGATIAASLPAQDISATVLRANPVLVETGRPLSEVEGDVLGASVYQSSRPVADALEAGANLVITGRVGDSALYMAPLAWEFGWDWQDWTMLARGMAVGHLMECGPQLTGGYFAAPPMKVVPNLARLGLPYAEVSSDGSAIVTKLAECGGKVTLPIAKEQLLYEIGDPGQYMHTDVVVDVTTATLADAGPDRVCLSGVSGHPRPDTLKALIAVHEGYLGECYVGFAGSDAMERAQLAAEVMRERIDIMGLSVRDYKATYLGVDDLFEPWAKEPHTLREVNLHLVARFATKLDAEAFVRDCFVGAGNHYGPAAGTPGRLLQPVEDVPTIYSAHIPRELIADNELVVEKI